MGKDILVTGSTGFIGRHLVKRLAGSSDQVYCLVRKTSNTSFLTGPNLKLIYGDIRDSASLTGIKQKFDIIYHCAAFVGNNDKDLLYKTNVLGTQNICDLSLRLGIKRMVYLSSVAVVSGNPRVPLVEDLPFKATNPYGESKIEAEKIVRDYRKAGQKSVIIRPCMVYGEDEPHAFKKVLSLVKWRLYPIIKGGQNRLHLVYVETVVDLLIFSLSKEEFLSGSYFIADREAFTFKELGNIFAQALGVKKPFELSDRISDILLLLPGIGKRLKFFLKDRVYSTKSVESLGFTYRYPARDSLIYSARQIKA
jgi:dihydroflavonol-4-reductase